MASARREVVAPRMPSQREGRLRAEDVGGRRADEAQCLDGVGRQRRRIRARIGQAERPPQASRGVGRQPGGGGALGEGHRHAVRQGEIERETAQPLLARGRDERRRGSPVRDQIAQQPQVVLGIRCGRIVDAEALELESILLRRPVAHGLPLVLPACGCGALSIVRAECGAQARNAAETAAAVAAKQPSRR